MADLCRFCGARNPKGGVKVLILGDDWVEFCVDCGDKPLFENKETGEIISPNELFKRQKDLAEAEGEAASQGINEGCGCMEPDCPECNLHEEEYLAEHEQCCDDPEHKH